MLNLQSYWRPTGRNFGAPKNMGVFVFKFWGLCFQDTRQGPPSWKFDELKEGKKLPFLCKNRLILYSKIALNDSQSKAKLF